MDQKRIGSFLRELRTEKSLTQEQLAERLNVSGRTVSRWENGNNMPDLSIIVELAAFYDIDIRELLNGERKSEKMNEDLKETLEAVAEYSADEKKKIAKDIYIFLIMSAVCAVMALLGLYSVQTLDFVTEFTIPNIFVLTLISAVYSTISIIKLNQMNGRKDKASSKEIISWILMIIIGLIVLIEAGSFFFSAV